MDRGLQKSRYSTQPMEGYLGKFFPFEKIDFNVFFLFFLIDFSLILLGFLVDGAWKRPIRRTLMKEKVNTLDNRSGMGRQRAEQNEEEGSFPSTPLIPRTSQKLGNM